jgi:SAM-dependent methyltransferase
MKKIESDIAFIRGILKKMEIDDSKPSSYSVLEGKIIIDMGCGTGELVRELAAAGARAIGVDSLDLLARVKEYPPVGNETYVPALGQAIPLKSCCADLIIFFASFHHVPGRSMPLALQEVRRVLVTGGIGIFLEPVGLEGSYFEIIRLVEDERKVQHSAYDAIKNAGALGLESRLEETYYFERSFADYSHCLQVFVDDDTKRNEYLSEARKLTETLSRAARVTVEDYRFKSIARLNVLQKP